MRSTQDALATAVAVGLALVNLPGCGAPPLDEGALEPAGDGEALPRGDAGVDTGWGTDVFAESAARALASRTISPHATDPFMFQSPSGDTLLATGYYGTAVNMTTSDWGGQYLTANKALIDKLSASGLNWMRLWANWGALSTGSSGWDAYVLTPYKRTGPGTAADGGLKLDLNQIDPTYLTLLSDTISYASGKGVNVQVILADCWHVGYGAGEFLGRDFYTSGNNINGVGFANLCEWTTPGTAAFQRQEALIRRIVKQIGGFSNVVWEVCNEMREPSSSATSCNLSAPASSAVGHPAFYSSIDAIIADEESRNGHPYHLVVPMDAPEHRDVGNHANCPTSEAQVDDQHSRLVSQRSTQHQPLISDNDSFNCTDPCDDGGRCLKSLKYAWGAFTAGAHVDLFHDEVTSQAVLNAANTTRRMQNVGSVQRFVRQFGVNPAGMVPMDSAASAGWTLARPGAEYVTYLHTGGATTLSGVAGTCKFRWFDPYSTANQSGAATGIQPCSSPFNSGATSARVLYVDVCGAGESCVLDQYDPIGFLDAISGTGVASGWACDQDLPTATIEVHFWSQNWSTFFGKVVASAGSEAAVNTACGGGTAHRFNFQLPANSNGVPVNAWAIDVTSGIGLLVGSPKTWRAPVTVTLYPTDDSWTEQANPTATHGSETTMRVRSNGAGSPQHSYLRFDVSSVLGAVQSAQLSLGVGTSPISTLGVYRIDHTSWSEATLNYNNASINSLGSQMFNNLAANSTPSLDVTALVKLTPQVSSPTVVTFGMSQADTTSATLYTRESAIKPRLTVTYLP